MADIVKDFWDRVFNTIEELFDWSPMRGKLHEEDCIRIKHGWKVVGERNPMHYCMNGCGKYLGHRGFCSHKCHDEYYKKEI